MFSVFSGIHDQTIWTDTEKVLRMYAYWWSTDIHSIWLQLAISRLYCVRTSGVVFYHRAVVILLCLSHCSDCHQVVKTAINVYLVHVLVRASYSQVSACGCAHTANAPARAHFNCTRIPVLRTSNACWSIEGARPVLCNHRRHAYASGQHMHTVDMVGMSNIWWWIRGGGPGNSPRFKWVGKKVGFGRGVGRSRAQQPHQKNFVSATISSPACCTDGVRENTTSRTWSCFGQIYIGALK